MEKIKRTFDYLFILLFFLALLVPATFLLMGFEENVPNYENRNKISFPKIRFENPDKRFEDLKMFPRRFQVYFNDNYFLREKLISVYADLKIGMFKTNPFPAQIVRGTGDWLFVGEGSSEEVRESLGFLTFSDAELTCLKSRMLDIKHILDSLNIKFYLAVAPNKATVYRQYLPILHTGKPTKLDQVKMTLHYHGIDLIDLKVGFENYPPGVLFYKTDTHWNDHGIFLGYLNLMQRLKRDGFNNLKIHKVSQYWQRVSGQKIIELTRVLRQPSIENKLIFIPKKKPGAMVLESGVRKLNNQSYKGFREFYRYKSNANSLKILVFHDSFFLGLHTFVMDGFGETVLTRGFFSKQIVFDEKPDIVVYEVIERHLDSLLLRVR